MSNQKPSRFRHANLTVPRRDQCYVDLKPTSALWDLGNMVAANPHVFALPILSLTGGRVAILPYEKGGKVPSSAPSLMSHTAPIVDLAFSPFKTELLVTGSEDSTVKLWHVPKEGLKDTLNDPIATIAGHGKKVGMVHFHPSAENVLLTASVDHHIKLWDLETVTEKVDLSMHTDMIQSVNFNLDGSLINTTCRDKKIRLIDCRSQEIVAVAHAHAGSKATRSVWAKRMNLILTMGFNKDQHRQMMVWDIKNMKSPMYTHEIDRLTSVFMPMFDEDTGVLYLAGKGDTSLSLWDVNPSRTPVVSHATTIHCGSEPHRGMCLLPRVTLRPKDCEIARLIRVTPNQSIPLVLTLPRKLAGTQFQDDIYPPTFASTPAMTSQEYFSGGACKPPLLKSLKFRFDEEEESSETFEYHHVQSTLNEPVASQNKNITNSSQASPERVDLNTRSSAPRSTETDYMEARRKTCITEVETAKKKVVEAKSRLSALEKELEEAQKRLDDCR